MIRQLELPLDPPDRAGEGALLMAEQLAVEQGVAEGGRVERDEGMTGTAGRVVNGPGQQGLPGAGLSQDQNRELGARRDPGEPEAGGHRLVVALEIVERVVPLPVAFSVEPWFSHRAGGSAKFSRKARIGSKA